VRNGVYRKRNAVLYANLAQQFGDVGFYGALSDAEWGANFLVRAAFHQHLQDFLLSVGKCGVGRQDVCVRPNCSYVQ
jgi:hypothetical protein